MANEADRAQVFEQRALQAALANRAPSLPRTGLCHNCADPVPTQALFCDGDCRDDWEKRQHMKHGAI